MDNIALSHWVAFDWDNPKTRPTESGKYLICRKDGKIHWEQWNGSGWAYNHKEIRFWAVIVTPIEENHFNHSIKLLRDLADLQNGAPLERHRKEWEQTMDEVYSFLEKWEK